MFVGLVAFVQIGCTPDSLPSVKGQPDDVGRMVRLSATPARIVSLSPATTELLFAIGAGDRLVGRTHWAGYPPAALDVTDIGDGFNPNVEAIASVSPDLVVAYASDVS